MLAWQKELVERLVRAECILVFTGAGISTASGIPDFRGPNGVWKRRQPVYFDDFLASEEKRREYWEFKLEAHPIFEAATPNAAHHAIAELERRGRVQAVVTQNIDGLHQAAGSQGVIELHGSARSVECLGCEQQFDPNPWMEEFRRTRRPPRCACGGLLKSATISFGQPLRPGVLEQALARAAGADLVLALGSTLSVQPAALVPLAGVRAGAPYVIINQGPTDHDPLANLRLEGDVSALLPAAVAALA